VSDELARSLVDDCRAILTEAFFTSRWSMIEGYHLLGKRIIEEKGLDRKDIYDKKILSRLADSLNVSERTL
jgi:hypothetical protein